MNSEVLSPKEGDVRTIEKRVLIKTIGLTTFYFQKARWMEKYTSGRWVATHFIEPPPKNWK